jgi:myosin heavy subunit
MLHPQLQKLSPNPIPKQIVPALLTALGFPEDKYKIGLTKVFLRAGLVWVFICLILLSYFII